LREQFIYVVEADNGSMELPVLAAQISLARGSCGEPISVHGGLAESRIRRFYEAFGFLGQRVNG
jgi:hypothetical protein